MSKMNKSTTSFAAIVNSLPWFSEMSGTRFTVDLITVAEDGVTENGLVTALVDLFFLGELLLLVGFMTMVNGGIVIIGTALSGILRFLLTVFLCRVFTIWTFSTLEPNSNELTAVDALVAFKTVVLGPIASWRTWGMLENLLVKFIEEECVAIEEFVVEEEELFPDKVCGVGMSADAADPYTQSSLLTICLANARRRFCLWSV